LDSDEEIFLLSGEIRKLRANYEQTVPLWFALMLKKQQKCQILAPYWMTETELQALYNHQCSS
jgi:GINS complex subunit 2